MENRNIDIVPYVIISSDMSIEHHTMITIINIIIEKDGYYYYIEDDIEKIRDVSSMPSYIKEDWINYNKKELDYRVIDGHLKKCNGLKDSYMDKSENDKVDEQISLLKSIRRDLIIKNIT